MWGEIVSGPGDLLTLSLSKHCDKSLSVIMMLLRTSLSLDWTAGAVGISLRSSTLNTKPKKVFRMLLVCSSSLV